MIPKLTDDAVSELPLLHGRAELLEEIMSTPVLDDRPVRDAAPRRPWLVPAAAAAVVAALALGAAWWTSGFGGEGDSGVDFAAAPAAADGQYVVLDVPGWQVSAAAGNEYGGEVAYRNGDREFDIAWYPADQYDSYVEDRRYITAPPSDGEPIEVLGLPAQLWAYSANDHAALRAVEGDWTLEFRGRGMDESAYLDLLDRLRTADRAGFEAALPPSFIDSAERDREIESMLAGIGQFVDPLFAPQGQRAGVGSDAVDPYQLGADVAGAVACSWLDDLVVATRTGDAARAQRATDVLVTARQWPVLKELDADGDYPEAVWGYTDQVERGLVPRGYAEALGCEG